MNYEHENKPTIILPDKIEQCVEICVLGLRQQGQTK